MSPGPLLSHSFSHWNGISPPQLQWNITPITPNVFTHWNRVSPPQLQWNITPITPKIFSYWNGTSPQCKHTQYFQPLEWNITALATGMEHHHSYTLSASSHWNGTSQLHPLERSINYHHSYSYTQWQLLSATGMEHHHSYIQNFQPLEWNIIAVTSKAFSHWNGTLPPQLYPMLLPTGMEHHTQLHPTLSPTGTEYHPLKYTHSRILPSVTPSAFSC